MSESVINVARDFSREPYGRLPEHGKNSGERFRHEFLLPALRQHDKVIVEMDGAIGYGSSWLEESFGGLVRFGYFKEEDLKNRLIPRHSLQQNVERVWRYVAEATFAGDAKRAPSVEARYKKG